MKNEIIKLMNQHKSIVIGRHKNPDLDAYGSQFGLYHALKEFFPNKNIYVIGDTNQLNVFGEMDEVEEKIRNESLLFILDTVSKQMLDEDIYRHYNKLVLIDHHRNDPDIAYDVLLQDFEASSTAEMITGFLLETNIPINEESARALYLGIIGDTGRFMYNNTTAKTLETASKLVGKGLDIQKLHDSIYLETKNSKTIKNIFFNKTQYTDKGLAYNKNDRQFLEDNNLSTYYVSRGLVNQMAGMQEVPIWVNFTEDLNAGNIICEIRSRDIPILAIAKKYGGGGHLNACGCTVEKWETVEEIINDLNELI